MSRVFVPTGGLAALLLLLGASTGLTARRVGDRVGLTGEPAMLAWLWYRDRDVGAA